MRALREKVGPRRDENQDDQQQEKKESEKKDAILEKRRSEGTTRDVMALEQLVESNGTTQKV